MPLDIDWSRIRVLSLDDIFGYRPTSEEAFVGLMDHLDARLRSLGCFCYLSDTLFSYSRGNSLHEESVVIDPIRVQPNTGLECYGLRFVLGEKCPLDIAEIVLAELSATGCLEVEPRVYGVISLKVHKLPQIDPDLN